MISEKQSIAFKAVAACLLWSTAFAGVKVSELNMWKFLIPEESPTIISLTGMAIIAISILYYYMPRKSGRVSN